jgi:hypothetical protein
MNGKSDETLSKTAKDEQPRRTNFRLVSREERQPELMRPGETARKLQRPRANHVTGPTTITIRVRPLPERQILNRNRR